MISSGLFKNRRSDDMITVLNAAMILAAEGISMAEDATETVAATPYTPVEGILELLARLDFTFAKTMPETPHWWVRKTEENLADYTRLFDTIKTHCRRERFGKYWYRYLYPGDGFKYWAMTTDVRYSRIMNRAVA